MEQAEELPFQVVVEGQEAEEEVGHYWVMAGVEVAAALQLGAEGQEGPRRMERVVHLVTALTFPA